MGIETVALALGASAELASTAATIGTVASIAGTAISGLGALQQSRAASASAKYNSQLAENNAKIASQDASFAGAEGETNAASAQAKTKAQIAATLANEGASGVDVNTGSSVNVRASEAEVGKLSAMQIRSNAAKQAYGYQTQQVGDQAQASLYKSQASADKTSGYISSASTVLGGVGSSASKYADFLQKGGGGVSGLTATPITEDTPYFGG